MSKRNIQPLPITPERFAPFGDVIECRGANKLPMNDARFDRFDQLSCADVEGDAAISIVRSRSATKLPCRVDMLERHPLGSQAFVPLTRFEFVVVVAPPLETVALEDIRAFSVPTGRGINYRRGTWHMPLIALGSAQEFLVVDYGGDEPNCEELFLDEPVMLLESRD